MVEESFADKERRWFFTRLIWLWPAAYAFHLLDEWPRFPEWVSTTIGGHMSMSRFYLNNSLFMVGLLTVCTLCAKKQTPAWTFVLFAWAIGHTFWNFWFHWYTTLRFHVVSPGVISSTILYYPISLYLAYLALRDRHLNAAALAATALIGVVAMSLVVWIGLYHGGAFPWRFWIG